MSGRIYDFTSLDPLDDIGISGAVGADNLPVIATIDDLARQALSFEGSFEGSLLDCWLSDVLLTQEQLHVLQECLCMLILGPMTRSIFQMEGHWDDDGTRMIDAIRKAAGNPRIKVGKMPWVLMRLLSPSCRCFGN